MRRYHSEGGISGHPQHANPQQICNRNRSRNIITPRLFSSFTVDKVLKLERLFLYTPCMPTTEQISEWSQELSLQKLQIWQWFRWKWNAKIEYEAFKAKFKDLNKNVFISTDENVALQTDHEPKRFELPDMQDAVFPNKEFVIEYENAEEDVDEDFYQYNISSDMESYEDHISSESDIWDWSEK